jgi:hypothetical protein
MRFSLCFAAALLALPSVPAPAQAREEPPPTVVLVRPPERRDPIILEAYTRTQAELELNGFRVVVVDPNEAVSSPKALAREANAEGAFAAIAVVRSNGQTTADVWITDRVTGKTSVRTLSTAKSDAPNLLAVRATDLLRVSLRELPPGEAPPADVLSRAPELTLSPKLESFAGTSAPKRALPGELRAEALLWWSGADAGTSLSPALGVGYRVLTGRARRPSVRLRATWTGPTMNQRVETRGGNAALRQAAALGEVLVTARPVNALELGAGVAAGAYHLDIRGQARAPLASQDDELFAFSGGPVLDVSLRLGEQVALGATARGLLFAPKLEVAIGNERIPLGHPSVQFASGLRVAF